MLDNIKIGEMLGYCISMITDPIKFVCSLIIFVGMGAPQQLLASSIFSFQEFDKKISAATGVVSTPFDSAFGERVNEFDGTTVFYVQDVSISGPSALTMVVGRRLIIQPGNYGSVDLESPGLSQFDDWELDLPSISGVWRADNGWKTDAGTWSDPQPTLQRCTYNGTAFDYWRWGSGITVNWGDSSSEPLLTSSDHNSSQFWINIDGSVKWSTESLAKFSCLASSKNGYPGEAFVATRPDGTRYYFDWIVEKPYAEVKYTEGLRTKYIPRKQVFALVSRVEDRHGNWLNYTYNGKNLTQITSNDGRSIFFTYDALNRVTAISSGGRSWVYTYREQIGNQRGGLRGVLLPDSSSWTYEKVGNMAEFMPVRSEDSDICGPPAGQYAPNLSFTAVAPSKAVGSFTFQMTTIQRDDFDCLGATPAYYFAFHLNKRVVTGPGLAPQTTTWAMEPVLQAYDYRWVTKTLPDGSSIRSKFGRDPNRNERQLFQEDIVAPNGVVMQSISHSYVEVGSANPFPERKGFLYYLDPGGWLIGRILPMRQTIILRNGVSYVSLVDNYDKLGRPLVITRSSVP